MASLEKTSANLKNSLERTTGDFAFSAVTASSVAVVSLATTRDPKTKWESPQIIIWRAQFLLAWVINWSSVLWCRNS